MNAPRTTRENLLRRVISFDVRSSPVRAQARSCRKHHNRQTKGRLPCAPHLAKESIDCCTRACPSRTALMYAPMSVVSRDPAHRRSNCTSACISTRSACKTCATCALCAAKSSRSPVDFSAGEAAAAAAGIETTFVGDGSSAASSVLTRRTKLGLTKSPCRGGHVKYATSCGNRTKHARVQQRAFDPRRSARVYAAATHANTHLHASIILAMLLVQLHTDPHPRRKSSLSKETHDPAVASRDRDDVAELDLCRHGLRRCVHQRVVMDVVVNSVCCALFTTRRRLNTTTGQYFTIAVRNLAKMP